MTATLLLIYDTLETIQYTQVILDFTILTKYFSYNKEILHYIEHALYKLEKTKLIFR